MVVLKKKEPEIVQLATPTNISFDGERIMFGAVENASSYEIIINEETHASEGTVFQYQPNGVDFTVRKSDRGRVI